MDDRRADRLSRLRDSLAQGEIVVLDGGTVFHDIAPAAFAASAADWVAGGATIVGGCRGIGSRHIAQLSGAVRARTLS